MTTGRCDRMISSRDYMSCSYKWSDLYLSSHADHVFQKYLLHLESLDRPECMNYKIEIFQFGFNYDEQRGFRQIISHSDLKEICKTKGKFTEMSKEEHFDFFALKYYSPNQRLDSNLSQPRNIAKSNDKLQIGKTKPSKVYVIFIDSLDNSIFDKPELINTCPTLKELSNNSLRYSKFTSSGFWTYPCLYSLHSGIPPYYSGAFMKIQPNLITNSKLLNQKSSESFFYSYLNLIAIQSDIRPTKLTSVLNKAGVRSAAIKTSTNSSEYWNILDGVDISIENSSLELIPDHLKEINMVTHNSIDAFFIDIDCLHRGHRFFRDETTKWCNDNLDWLNPSQTKTNRLLGIQNSNFSELEREHSQLIKTDKILGKILETISDEDTVILFSDNGSKCILPSQIFNSIYPRYLCNN